MTDTFEPYDPDPTRPGEPLPVGAHAEDAGQSLPADPPGMPKAPDDLDRRLADYVDSTYNGDAYYGSVRKATRPDSATIPIARRGGIVDNVTPRTVREALLVQVQQAAHDEDEAAKMWANGVRAQQEGRDLYVAAEQRRLAAEAALVNLDLWREDDNEPEPEPKAGPERIPDDMIH